MLAFEGQNLLETLHPIGPLCGDGSFSRNNWVHRYQRCLGSKCKTSSDFCIRAGLCVVTGLAAEIVQCNAISDAWVRHAKLLRHFASDGALVRRQGSQQKLSGAPLAGMRGFRLRKRLGTIQFLETYWEPCGKGWARKPNASSRECLFFGPPPGMFGFEMKHVLYFFLEEEVRSMTVRAANMHYCTPIRDADAWVRFAKLPWNFASYQAVVW